MGVRSLSPELPPATCYDCGKKVKFTIISKDSKGNDKPAEHLGSILFPNRTRTGYVIRGKTIHGIYNRVLSDIVILDPEPEYSAQVIDCENKKMMAVA